jgi:succinylarginine dihydrolase
VVLEALLHLVAELAELGGGAIVHHDVSEEQVHVLQHSMNNGSGACCTAARLQLRLAGTAALNICMQRADGKATLQRCRTLTSCTASAYVEEGLR